jgi:hypothetical protein
VFGLNRALEETLPALQTTVTITLGIGAFVSVLAAGVVAAWSIAFYFWLLETMPASQSAFLVGLTLLVLCGIAIVVGRIVIRSSAKPEKPSRKANKHDALASAIEAMGDIAGSRPVPAILSALALGLAAGFFADDDSD